MDLLYHEIETLCFQEGTSYLGIGDLTRVFDTVMKYGGNMVRPYSRAIVLGIILLDPIIDMLPDRKERSIQVCYQQHYDVINQRLDLISSKIANIVQKNGYQALPVPSSERVDDEKISSFFSHKMAARQAGLGWIGKNCLLITPDNGPRVRWTTVLTDAPLNVTGTPMKGRCGLCTACVDICPVQAFTGEPFREDEDRDSRFDVKKCDKYFQVMRKTQNKAVCGLCMYVCPYGKNPKKNREI